MKLSFHGADRDVTGSCHLLEVAGKRILVDCGMLQGGRELAEQNAGEFGFDASSVDVVLLTHAHLDHCGRLPLLVKRGFKGEILATSATQELARLVLLDAANLQEEEARRAAMHTRRRGVGAQVEPLYSIPDALNALGSFGRAAPYNAATPLGAGIDVTFYEAGHILGSASVLVEATEGGTTRTILFSGDIGNAGRPLLRAPSPPARADFIVMESTYGDRLHRSMQGSIDELYGAIGDTFARGGNVIIPTFALERAQEILFFLHRESRSASCRHRRRCFWIRQWRFRRRRYSGVIPSASRRMSRGCSPTGTIRSACPTFILRGKARIRSRSTASRAARS